GRICSQQSEIVLIRSRDRRGVMRGRSLHPHASGPQRGDVCEESLLCCVKISPAAIQRLVVVAELMPQRGNRSDRVPVEAGRVMAYVERSTETLASQQQRQPQREWLAVVDVKA